MSILSKIQSQLHAPKSQFNNFGKYKYRNCEDILEALKPLLSEYDATVTISDEIIAVSDRVYIKATATFKAKQEIESVTAYAREPLQKKGMDESQITGASSSYARKYALNGLFAIDDTRDADSNNTHGKEAKNQSQPVNKAVDTVKPIARINACLDLKSLHDTFKELWVAVTDKPYRDAIKYAYDNKKAEMEKAA